MKKQLIITHPGGAHFDEMTAISFILAVHNNEKFSIERREPSISELDDPNIWVIDIGNRHEPEGLNFDHHQDQNCPAAFVLVADYLGLLDIMSVQPWWEFKDSVDRIGPVRSSLEFNAGDDLVNRNPIEIWMTSRFAADPEVCVPMLKSFGTQLIGDARMLKKQIDFWKNSRRLTIAGLPAMVGETKESLGLEEFRRFEKDPPDIVISLDRRGEGWRLFRFEGAPVNFSLIANDPEINFAHKTGFQATTRERISMDKVITLVSKAVTRH